MPDKDVSLQDFLRNPLLPGIANFSVWRRRRDLLSMLFFHRVAKHNPHLHFLFSQKGTNQPRQ
jgi:hypothetical protein